MNAAETTITVLVDNQAGPGLTAEHGFSLWLETGGLRLLFDTGQGPALAGNARLVGIDLTRVDCLVLSHGHYDHSGGLAEVLCQSRRVDLYCHPGAVSPRYSIRDGVAKPLQMPRAAMTALDRLGQERVHWLQQPVWLSETVGLSGPIARNTDFEDSGGPFFLDADGRRPDRIDDDLALWIRTDQGLIVCLGCAHAGLINSLAQIQRLNNGMRIRAVIGGLHLQNASPRRLEQTLVVLARFAPDCLIPCHCTGEAAMTALVRSLGSNRCRPGAAGMRYTFSPTSASIEYGYAQRLPVSSFPHHQ